MRTPPTIEAVAFDFNGVLTDDPIATLDRLYRGLGVEPDHVRTQRRAARTNTTEPPLHRLERGEMSIDEFQTLIDHRSPGTGPVWDPSSEWCIAKHLPVRHDMAALIAALQGHNIATLIASNNAHELWPIVLGHTAHLPIDTALNSAELGTRKPEPAFYAALVAAANRKAERILFVDDHQANVDAAHTAGLQTLHLNTHAAAITTIERLCGLGQPPPSRERKR
jgi:HAD superfamily hydrolase (TIGR01509 family)